MFFKKIRFWIWSSILAYKNIKVTLTFHEWLPQGLWYFCICHAHSGAWHSSLINFSIELNTNASETGTTYLASFKWIRVSYEKNSIALIFWKLQNRFHQIVIKVLKTKGRTKNIRNAKNYENNCSPFNQNIITFFSVNRYYGKHSQEQELHKTWSSSLEKFWKYLCLIPVELSCSWLV